jgi:hypothetical protein
MTFRFFAACIFVSSAVSITAAAQDKADPTRKVRVYVTDSDSWQMMSTSGGGLSGFGAGFGSLSRAGARPQTAEIIKTIGQRCPEVIVNDRPEMSDYVIRLEHEGGKGPLAHKDKVAVFVRKSGDSIFSNSTITLGGSVQGACAAIDKHWSTNAAELSAVNAPPPPPPVAAAAPASAPADMASLMIEASVPGADIEVDGEFMGNTPSTLSVVPGKHTITVKKKGYADWSRTMNVSGSAVHLNAEMDLKP